MSSKARLFAVWAAVLALGIVFSGCGSGNPAIGITLSPSGTQNVVAGQSLTITAQVMHDSKNAGVTWSLSPSSGAGTLSAQTTTSVTYTAPSPIPANATATITVTSISDTSKSISLTINLQAVSIALSPSTTQTDEQTQTSSVTAAVSNDPTTAGVTWSLNAGAKGTLSGKMATGVTYNAPASVTAAATDTITATSAFDTSKTATLMINLVPPPSITTTQAQIPSGTVNSQYSTTIAATYGVTPYSWSWTAQAGSSLPPGLSIGSSTGTISGTPGAYGTFNITVQVKDANNFMATASLSIKINPAPLTVTTTSLPNVIVNTPGYSATLMSTGGATPITWSWAAQAGSTLPPGLVLAPTGGISGTPTSAGTFNVTVTATDSSTPALTASKNLSVTIIPQLVITTSSPLPNGITNTAYTGVTLASTGGFGAVVWSLTGGATNPAPGLTLNASTGAITGTPTTAGTFNFTAQAADSGTPQQKVTKAFTITIIQQLVITTSATLPTGSVTTPYSVQLASSGGTGAVTWAFASGSTPPGGLGLSATGLLSGIPTTANTFHFSITATDSGTPPQTATVAFTLTITPKLAITTTQAQIPSGTVNTNYSTTIQSNNGGISPLTWSWTAQTGSSTPPGLSINASTGTISGKPTTAGTFNVTVTVTDSGTPTQTASANFSISVATAPLSVTTTSLPNAVVGQAYNATLVSAGGNPPVTWSISAGSPPSWASLNSSTGAITGTPPNSTGSPFNFTVKATDSSTPAQTATQALTITVVNALTITTTSLPNGTVGNMYSTTVTATGGTMPYTWSWAAQAASSLPPGLSINPGTGAITGTPSSAGTFNVTVTVKDTTSPQQTTSANLSITITVATLTVTTTSSQLPTGTVSTMYPNTQLNASGGISPYSWTWMAQTGSQLPPGLSLSTAGAITGTPTMAGTFNVTVTVTDSETPAMSANANLMITVNTASACTPGNSESLLNGQYAFLLKGFDNGTGVGETSPQPALVGGVITVDGAGHITAGTVDLNGNSTAGVLSRTVISGSVYGVGSDHRGCLAINTSAGTQNYRFSLGNISGGVASTGHMINFDAAGPFTAGVLRKQNTSAFITSQVTGNYAFGVSSIQNTASCNNGVCGGKFGAVGVFNFSTGSVTGGEVDFNTNGAMDGNLTSWPASGSEPTINAGGTYTIDGTSGRGTLTFTPSASNPVHAVVYVVSATEVLILGSDDQKTNSAFAGSALRQSGAFSSSTFSGTYVAYQSGLGSTTGTASATLLLITASGGTINGTQIRNKSGTVTMISLPSTPFSVDSNGRMLLAGGASNTPILYIVNGNQGFILNSQGPVETGFIQTQTGTSAGGSYAFGRIDPEDANVGDNSGVVTLTSGNITGSSDNSSSGGQQVNGSITATYSVDAATGLGHIPSGCTVGTNCQLVFLVVSPTQALLTELQHSNGTAQTNPAISAIDQ